MIHMCRTFCFAICLSLLVTACSAGKTQWLARSDQPAFGRMLAETRQARAVFVGEFHDKRNHHILQLDIIKALQRDGIPLAIGLEMFDMESQPALDRWVRGEMGLQEFIAYYQKGWTINWAEYDEIFLYARNNRIPLRGLNAPAEVITKVFRSGFTSLPHQDLARLPSGVGTGMGESYRNFLRLAFGDHRMDETMFNRFCEAQALRNNTMGKLIADYLAAEPGSTMVVITGVGHAMRRAVADDLNKQEHLTTRVIIPVTEGLFDKIDEDDADFFVTY